MTDVAPDETIEPNLTGKVQRRMAELRRRVLTVVRVQDVAPSLRSIVLTGDDLEENFPFAHFAPGDHVKIFFPDPSTGKVVFPERGEKGFIIPEGGSEPVIRDYSVRAFDAEAKELTLEFVLHEHGPAGRWAIDAKPGGELGVAGPRGNVLLPQNYANYVAAGDESALPAIARFLEEAPADAEVTAVITISDSRERVALHEGAKRKIVWVERDSAPVGEGHLSALETAIRALDLPEDIFIFAAGEAGMLKPIRRYFRFERNIPREQMDVDGYWKQGVIALDHHANEVGDD